MGWPHCAASGGQIAMPELMQLGPDDNDIDPYLAPCPADYPPCPLCGKHPDMLESGHIICCNILVDNPDAWFLLPRAMSWTHEPPKVAGKYWWRSSQGPHAVVLRLFSHKGEIGYWEGTGTFRSDLQRGQWAGPIPPPID